jgi:hypothetical protein
LVLVAFVIVVELVVVAVLLDVVVEFAPVVVVVITLVEVVVELMVVVVGCVGSGGRWCGRWWWSVANFTENASAACRREGMSGVCR